ncbi:MAG TPA: glycosyltransferase [Candidatus Lumbricidophila sp.]|nr:glycosyltransferase [Candidatus Lumbricidophila sp.]
MLATLTVPRDAFNAPAAADRRYSALLARALVETAPSTCTVVGFYSSTVSADEAAAEASDLGMQRHVRSRRSRRTLSALWAAGIAGGAPRGMWHSASLFAPLHTHRHDHGEQVVVTMHNTLAWDRPAADRAGAAQQRLLFARAERHADAIVVPSHALAERISGFGQLGDRIRVIPGAPTVQPGFDGADDDGDVAALPSDFIVVSADTTHPEQLTEVLRGISLPGTPDIAIVVVGQPPANAGAVEELAAAAGLSAGRVQHVAHSGSVELTAILGRASAVVAPRIDDMSGTDVLNAFAMGTPVVCVDTPAYRELAGDTDHAMFVEPGDGFAEGVSASIIRVLEHADVASRFALAGADRAAAYTWSETARQVWRLHAEI